MTTRKEQDAELAKRIIAHVEKRYGVTLEPNVGAPSWSDEPKQIVCVLIRLHCESLGWLSAGRIFYGRMSNTIRSSVVTASERVQKDAGFLERLRTLEHELGLPEKVDGLLEEAS